MKKLNTFVLISLITVMEILIPGCKKNDNNEPFININGVTNGAQYFIRHVPIVIITIGSTDGELKSLTIDGSGWSYAPTILDIFVEPNAALDTTSTCSPFLFKSG